jgi:hypothetical protein
LAEIDQLEVLHVAKLISLDRRAAWRTSTLVFKEAPSISLQLLLFSMALLAGSALIAAILGRRDRAAMALGTTSAILASVVGAAAALLALRSGAALVWRSPLCASALCRD